MDIYTKLTDKNELDNNDSFIAFLREMLKKGNMKDEWINEIIRKRENIEIYKNAFTNKSIDSANNYELYELLGDKIVNACVMEYVYKSFPEYRSSSSVSFFSKIIAKYCSKNEFSRIGKKVGFHKFIVATKLEHDKNRDKMTEDVFESFFGATNLIINNDIRQGVGYAIIYDIIENIFKNNVIIDTRYTSLVDSKTILKELFDSIDFKTKFGIPTSGTGNDLKYLDNTSYKGEGGPVYVYITHPQFKNIKGLEIYTPSKMTHVEFLGEVDRVNQGIIINSFNELLYNKTFPIKPSQYNTKTITNVLFDKPRKDFNKYEYDIDVYLLLSLGTGNNKAQASNDAAYKLLEKLSRAGLYDPRNLNEKYDRKYKGLPF
jgi:dsRNA-specific ribonuclease